jgi:hypothetical protein
LPALVAACVLLPLCCCRVRQFLESEHSNMISKHACCRHPLSTVARWQSQRAKLCWAHL